MALILGAEIHFNKKGNDQDFNVPLHPTVLQTMHTAVVFPNIILNPTVLQTKHTAVVFPNITLHPTVLRTKHTAVVFPNIILTPTVLQKKQTAVVFPNNTLQPTVLQTKHTVVVLPHTALNIHHSVHFQINITDLKHVSTLSCSCIRHQSTAKYELECVMFQIPVPITRTGIYKRSY
jgi:hypothetical protein